MEFSKLSSYYCKFAAALLLTLFSLQFAYSQSKRPLFGVGLRDTRYIFAEYYPIRDLTINLEHSLYSENFGFQRINLSCAYQHSLFKGFTAGASLNAATTWKGSYQIVGGKIFAAYDVRFLRLNAVLNPYYDTGIGYHTSWQIGLGFSLYNRNNNHISLIMAYTTIPEFRISEERVRLGFEFRVKNLTATPEVSIGMKKGEIFRNLRILASIKYLIPRK